MWLGVDLRMDTTKTRTQERLTEPRGDYVPQVLSIILGSIKSTCKIYYLVSYDERFKA